MQNCTNEVCVIESKPEHSLDDLRLGDPWPDLLEAARSIDLDALDPTAHSHVPYGRTIHMHLLFPLMLNYST